MQYYVEVIGSVDQVIVGPFASHDAAKSYVHSVPHNFDASVLDHNQLMQSFAEFGDLPIQSPE